MTRFLSYLGRHGSVEGACSCSKVHRLRWQHTEQSVTAETSCFSQTQPAPHTPGNLPFTTGLGPDVAIRQAKKYEVWEVPGCSRQAHLGAFTGRGFALGLVPPRRKFEATGIEK